MQTRTLLKTFVLVAVLTLCNFHNAQAAINTWNGGGSGGNQDNWSDKQNWGGTDWANGNDATFQNVTGGNSTTPLVNAAITVGTITFANNAANFSISASGANVLTINSGITFTTGGAVTSSETISAPIALGGNNTWTITDSPDSLTVSGIISQSGGSRTLLVNGAGTLTMSGSGTNTYSGLTTVSAGTLLLAKSGSANAIAGGGLTVGSASTTAATVQYTGASSDMMGAGAVTLNGRGILDFNGKTDTIGNVTINATGAGAGTTPIKNTAGGGNLTIGTLGITPVAGFTSVVDSGTGTLTLGGNVTFTAATTGQAQITGTTLALGGNRNVTVGLGTGSGFDLDIASAITGSGNTLTADGAGRLQLSGGTANTYSGLTTVSAGTLLLAKSGSANAIAGGGLTVGSASTTAATVQYTGASSDMMGAGAVTLNGRGILDFNGKTDTIGNVTINATGAGAGTTPIKNTAGGGNLTIGTLGITPVAGFTSVVDSGTGTLTLGGNVTFTAATTGQAQITGTTLALGGNRNVTVGLGTGSGFDLDIASAITGSGNTLTADGAGRLQLSGGTANTYSGLTTVSAGTLLLNKTAGVNAVAGNVAISGGTLKLLADEQINNSSAITMSSGAFDLNGKTETVTSFDNSGGTFTTGTGTLHGTGNTTHWSGGVNTINNGGLVDDKHVDITGGVNTVEGGSSGGVLKILSGGVGLEMTGSTLTLNSDNTVAGKLLLQGNVTSHASATTSFINSGLALANKGNINLDGGTRTFTIENGSAADDMSISAVIANGGLTKDGAGTLTLSGANTYTGGTTLSAGTLKLGADNVMPDTGTFTFAGGILDANNKSDTIGPLSLTANSTLLFGDATARQDITFSSALTYVGGTLTVSGWDGPTGTTYDRFIITADPTSSGILSHIQFDGYALGAAWISGTGEIVPVPEPINVALGVFGVVFAGVAIGRRLKPGCRRSPAG